MNRLHASVSSFTLDAHRATMIRHDTNMHPFTICYPICPGKYFVRSNEASTDNYAIGKELYPFKNIVSPKYLFKPLKNGLFSEDGELLWSGDQSCIIYVRSYKNEISCLDSNLALRYTTHTIDTIYNPPIQVAKIGSVKYTTFAAPPEIINEKSCVYNNALFIISKLRADNEDRRISAKSSVIDIYNLDDGQYKYSFYFSNFEKSQRTDFRIIDSKRLAVIQGDYLVIYPLNITLK